MEDNLLVRHVGRFNEAVRSGDYAPMLSAFAPEAEMVFVGVRAGRMLLSARDGLINRLVVTFESPSSLLRPLTQADVPAVERLWQLYS